jgi:hypothetical protein
MRWAEATEDRIKHIAHRVRKQDEIEVANSHGITGFEAVYESWAASCEVRCIEGDSGEPVGVTGVVPGDLGGVIWLLGTEDLLATPSHCRQFVRGGKAWVNGLVNEWGYLHNWVYWKNKQSMRWLESLGFKIHPPAPFGPYSQLFSLFERRGQ